MDMYFTNIHTIKSIFKSTSSEATEMSAQTDKVSYVAI